MKGIIFDNGNTILKNNNLSLFKSVKKVYKLALSPKVDFKDIIETYNTIYNETFSIRKTIEFSFIAFIKLLQKKHGLVFDIPLEEVEYQAAEELADVEVINGVVQFLDYCKDMDYKMIVLSNSTFSSITIKRQLGDMANYFNDIISSADYGVRKPAQSFFELGIAAIGLTKEEVVYLGNDYYYDIYGANKANIKAIWLNEENVEVKSNYHANNYVQVNSYEELINIFKGEN